MRYFSTIQRDGDSFFVVGGMIDTIGIQRKVLKFEANVWSHEGDLQITRGRMHALAFNGNELLIIGGTSNARVGDAFENNDAT